MNLTPLLAPPSRWRRTVPPEHHRVAREHKLRQFAAGPPAPHQGVGVEQAGYVLVGQVRRQAEKVARRQMELPSDQCVARLTMGKPLGLDPQRGNDDFLRGMPNSDAISLAVLSE